MEVVNRLHKGVVMQINQHMQAVEVGKNIQKYVLSYI